MSFSPLRNRCLSSRRWQRPGFGRSWSSGTFGCVCGYNCGQHERTNKADLTARVHQCLGCRGCIFEIAELVLVSLRFLASDVAGQTPWTPSSTTAEIGSGIGAKGTHQMPAACSAGCPTSCQSMSAL